jgi:hypothetical protein
MDTRGTRGTGFSQEYPQESSNIDCSDYRRANAHVYLSDNPSGQRGFGGRARRAREFPKGATTGYFVSEVLSESKMRYSQMQKLVYAILMTKRKLWHYFDAHPITVMSKYPLGEVIQNPEVEGRITKWALELMGQNITYAPRSAIKSQVLTDFVAEWTEIQTSPVLIEHETWTMYFDGSVMKEGAGVGLVFISPLGVRMEDMVRLHFPA